MGMLINNFDTEKLFLGRNRFQDGLFDEPNNAGEFTLKEGTVLGRIAASGKLAIWDATATDGSQIPVGVASGAYTMEGNEKDVPVAYCREGDVNENLVETPDAQSLDSVVTMQSGAGLDEATSYTRRLRDLLGDNGIQLKVPDQLSKNDNQ